MTRELLITCWDDVRRDCRGCWGKLTDDDLDRIAGQFEPFVHALRARYGFSQLKAEDELERLLFRYSRSPGPPAVVAGVDALP
jgi:uncharacterized protein YjbJ (UPF0337 family)